MRKSYLPILTAGLLGLAAHSLHAQAPSADEARVMRFPTTHGNAIVFSYAGDLYRVDATGGTARRLTSHEGMELFPRFSPDGRSIAFSGQYDGNTEVYVIPAEGGDAARITWTATLGRDDVSDRMGPNNLVMGWTPDGGHVVFRSRMRSFNDFIGQLYLAPLGGDQPTQVPVPRGGFLSYAPDGQRFVYNRVFREFRTWKRYRGGMADDVWMFDPATKTTTNLTENPAQDIIPMWHGNTVYFLSDRGEAQKMNLYAYDLGTKQTRQITRYTDFDIKFPSLGDNAIVFEQGGWLWRHDLTSGTTTRVPVYIREDFASSRGGRIGVADRIAGATVAPDGARVVFSARGELFNVPASSGITRNLTNSSGAHDRQPAWSPDGKTIAYLSDASGADEIWVVAQDGSAPGRQLTRTNGSYKFSISWSPDGKWLTYSDRSQTLNLVDATSGTVTKIAESDSWTVTDLSWSPDSQWLAYTWPRTNAPGRVMLYSVAQKKTWPVTDEWYDANSPAFSQDGLYLFFASSRDFNPVYSNTEWNHAYVDMERVYFVTLNAATPSPFAPKLDETGATPAAAAPAPPAVQPEGIGNRVVVLDTPPGNYWNISARDGKVWYQRGGFGQERPTFHSYDLKDQKEADLGSISGYVWTWDGKKMLVSQRGRYGVIDAPKGAVNLENTVPTDGLVMHLDRRAEWYQIYDESWRQMRDFFYDPGMHGNDWAALRDAYRPWISGIRHRSDLTYILGELIGELNAGHAYVGGGDWPRPDRTPMGLLGAELSRDRSGMYRIDRILEGENWMEGRRSPLTEPGLNVETGQFIVSVNGRPVSEMRNIQEALVGTAGKPVVLGIHTRPQLQGARAVTVVPTDNEAQLYYYSWVRENIRRVDAATGGRVGYIHVPDMGPAGLNEFIKHYYPQLTKEALIIDVRGNGGGNVSPMLIERLRREAIMMTRARGRAPTANPTGVMPGPMITLMNEFSASDGDIFPYRFRASGLGKLVGKRSWGGVVGIWGSLPFVDGGSLQKPESALYDIQGREWIIEGYGVDPDIVVDNDPWLEFTGTDQQLNRGIQEILKELAERPGTLPPPPPYPVKN